MAIIIALMFTIKKPAFFTNMVIQVLTSIFRLKTCYTVFNSDQCTYTIFTS